MCVGIEKETTHNWCSYFQIACKY